MTMLPPVAWACKPHARQNPPAVRVYDIAGVTAEGILAFLVAYFAGVNGSNALDLIDAYGETNILDALWRGHDGVSDILPPETAKAISSDLRGRDRHQFQSLVETYLLLHEVGGATLTLARRLARLHGADSPRLLREDPFEMAVDGSGLPFAIADELWTRRRGDPAAPIRHLAKLLEVLRHKSRLSATWFAADDARRLADQEGIRIREAVALGVERGVIRREERVACQPMLALEDRANDEERIAACVAVWLAALDAVWPSAVQMPGLSDHQGRVWGGLTAGQVGKLLLLVGPPGTGKTVLAYNVVAWAIRRGLRVVVVAPTARAAAVLTEKFRRAGLMIVATTVHIALGARKTDRGSAYDRGRSNPLDADLVIVDECSMLGADLAAALFESIPPAAQVLLLGDRDQLPSVGHGCVLGDLIRADVPFGRLSVQMRNAGTPIADFVALYPTDAPLPELSKELAFGGIVGSLAKLDGRDKLSLVRKVFDEAKRTGIPPHDAQIIAQTNKTCQEVNLAMQKRLNPADGEREGSPRLGDRIVNHKNRKFPIAGKAGASMHIANGEQGVIEALKGRKATIRMDGGEFVECFIPAGRTACNEGLDAFDDWSLAYCVTCHKAQGSEWPLVVVVLDKSQYLDRSWVYTAFSRASEHCVLVGDTRQISNARDRRCLDSRLTLLAERIADRRRGG